MTPASHNCTNAYVSKEAPTSLSVPTPDRSVAKVGRKSASKRRRTVRPKKGNWANAGNQDPYKRFHKTGTSKKYEDSTPTTRDSLPEANVMAHSAREKDLADFYQNNMSAENTKNEYATSACNNREDLTTNDEAIAKASQTLETQDAKQILNGSQPSHHPLTNDAKAYAKTATRLGYQYKTTDGADAEESDSTSSNESSVITEARKSEKYKSDNGFLCPGNGSDDCTHYKDEERFFDEEDDESEDDEEEEEDSDEQEDGVDEGEDEEEDESDGEGEDEEEDESDGGGEDEEEDESEGGGEDEGEGEEEEEEEEDKEVAADTTNKKDGRDTKFTDDSSVSSSFDVSIDRSNDYKPRPSESRRIRGSDPPRKQLTLKECVPRYVTKDSNAPSNEY